MIREYIFGRVSEDLFKSKFIDWVFISILTATTNQTKMPKITKAKNMCRVINKGANNEYTTLAPNTPCKPIKITNKKEYQKNFDLLLKKRIA